MVLAHHYSGHLQILAIEAIVLWQSHDTTNGSSFDSWLRMENLLWTKTLSFSERSLARKLSSMVSASEVQKGRGSGVLFILITSMLLPRKSSENYPGLRVGNLTL
jgi:hypothetical protein